jgi:hypothetical protein
VSKLPQKHLPISAPCCSAGTTQQTQSQLTFLSQEDYRESRRTSLKNKGSNGRNPNSRCGDWEIPQQKTTPKDNVKFNAENISKCCCLDTGVMTDDGTEIRQEIPLYGEACAEVLEAMRLLRRLQLQTHPPRYVLGGACL